VEESFIHARFILLGLSGEGSVLNPGQLD